MMNSSKINKGYVRHLIKTFKFESCKGCSASPEVCLIISTGNQDICPCINCLIKTMCVLECDKYIKLGCTAVGCTSSDDLVKQLRAIGADRRLQKDEIK
jgi:hypothetical protein